MKYFESASHMIMEAMKAGEKAKAETYKLMKNEFLKWKTSAQNAGKELQDADEVAIIKKMIKERRDSVEIYISAGRAELAEKELTEIAYLQPLLPAEPTEEDVRKVVEAWMSENGVEAVEQKQMGIVIGYVKSHLSGVDGKLTSDVVRSFIQK